MKLNGPGKYDDECKAVKASTNAVGVLLMVVEGDRGNGVSFRTSEPELMRILPRMLEQIAQQMRLDAQGDAN